MKKSFGFSVIVLMLTTAISFAGPTTTSGYTVTILHPAGFDSSYAYDVSNGQQVGYGYPTGEEEPHALLWSGTADSVVDLTPPGFNYSRAYGVSGGQQVGYGVGPATGGEEHALLWSGTAESFVDLTPSGFNSSFAHGISGGQQVGSGNGDATLWVGDDRGGHALLWSGNAESYIDLHPTGFGYSSSIALGTSGSQQVGASNIEDRYDFHASLWSGTSDSFVNLHPDGFGGLMPSISPMVSRSALASYLATHLLFMLCCGLGLPTALWTSTLSDFKYPMHWASRMASRLAWVLEEQSRESMLCCGLAPQIALWTCIATFRRDMNNRTAAGLTRTAILSAMQEMALAILMPLCGHRHLKAPLFPLRAL